MLAALVFLEIRRLPTMCCLNLPHSSAKEQKGKNGRLCAAFAESSKKLK